MHIFKDNIVWHSYTKCKEGKTYGIITKRVDGVLVLNLKATFETRKEAKKAANIRCKQLSIEELSK
jgi:hypothetical protein